MILRHWAIVSGCVLALCGSVQSQEQASPAAVPQSTPAKPDNGTPSAPERSTEVVPSRPSEAAKTSDGKKADSLEVPGAEKNQAKNDDARPAGNTLVESGANQPPQNQAGGGNRRQSNDGVGVVHGDSSSPEALTAKFTLWLFIATLFLAVATFSLALSTRGLYRQTERLADEAVKQGEKTERQIEISEQSAKAAQIAAQAASGSLASERAWVMFAGTAPGTAHKSTIGGKYYEDACIISLAWKNFGRSPALDAKLFITHLLVPKGKDPGKFEALDFSKYPGVAFPPSHIHQSGFTVIEHNDFVKIRRGELIGFVYGCCEYLESPSSNVIRRTEFCGQIAMVEFRKQDDGSYYYEVQVGSWGNQNTAT